MNTTKAEAKLKEAKDAFANEDYNRAIILSSQAVDLIPKAEVVKTPAKPKVKQKQSNLLICVGVSVVIILIGAGVYLVSRKKKNSKGEMS